MQRQILWRVLTGQLLETGYTSPFHIDKERVYGTSENPNGPCRVQNHLAPITTKQIGLRVGNKRHWYLHQIAFAYKFRHLPLNEFDGKLKGKRRWSSSQMPSTLVIAHSCGRNNCLVTDHMDVVLHKHNLIQCRCHDDLRAQNKMDCFKSINRLHGFGRHCWSRHPGLRCHYNFK